MTDVYRNAVIKSAEVYIEAHNLLTVWLLLDLGNSTVQGFGGWCLFNPSFPDKDRGGQFIRRVLEVAGVKKWSELPGKTVRVEGSGVGLDRIGHILTDDWFTPSTDLAAL